LKKALDYIAISSIAIIGVYLFAFAVLGVYLSVSVLWVDTWKATLFLLVSILGIAGFGGIALLFFYPSEKYLRLTFYLLCCGLLSFVCLFFISGYSVESLVALLTDKYEYPENAIFLWFISLSVFYTIEVGRKSFR
jgi:hypothetical protein